MTDSKRVITKFGSEAIIVFEDQKFDAAIVDVVKNNQNIYAIYDYNKLIDVLINENMTKENATEYINEMSKLKEPIILFPMENS